MSTAPFEQPLDLAVSQVFESMCFLAADPCIPGDAAGAEPFLAEVRRCLEFSGPRPGSFGLRTTLPSARMFASNLLGDEALEIEDAQAAESLGEIANMVCGAVLGLIEPEQAFDLTHPHDEPVDSVPLSPANVLFRKYQVEDEILEAWIEFQGV